ncbi:BQ2448_4993 [Microbotryum intermedium]|uniref:BQ2448_4993 protein n=1 Tax=Microbotryum intermedium TaxID=269621 RepID=A0A238FHN2_9BASI|nr:BQ2448_4993 [Microbotryum intermedium]
MSTRTCLVRFRGTIHHLTSTLTELVFERCCSRSEEQHQLSIAWDRIGTVLQTSSHTFNLSWIVAGQEEQAVVEQIEWIKLESDSAGQDEVLVQLQSINIPSHLLRLQTTDTIRTAIHIIYNPTCTGGSSTQVLRTLLTLLSNSGYVNSEHDIKVYQTQAEGDGKRIGNEIALHSPERVRTVVVIGGDGTIGEVVNGLGQRIDVDEVDDGNAAPNETALIVVPLGTANALYYHHFPPEEDITPYQNEPAPDSALHLYRSLFSFLHRRSRPFSVQPQPLAIASNIVPRIDSTVQRKEHVLTTVVTSTALHANILFDAERLRPTHRGVERFKLAAMENAKRWFEGKVSLTGRVRRFEGKKWVEEEGDAVILLGPFVYCIASLVSRFEKDFVVAPLRRSVQDGIQDQEMETSFDVVLIRPLRDPSTKKVFQEQGPDQAKEAFVPSLWETFGGMYQGGKHVGMKWEDGENRVEYYRCAKMEWHTPDSADIKDRLVCLDGVVRDLGRSSEGLGKGTYVTTALGSRRTGFKIWA